MSLEWLPLVGTAVAGVCGAAIADSLVDAQFPAVYPFRSKLARLVELGFPPGQPGAVVSAWAATSASGLTYVAIVQQQIVVALMLMPLIYVAIAWTSSIIIEKRERLLRNQLADLAQHMAGAVRGNLSPGPALESAIGAAPMPLAKLLSKVTSDIHRGAQLNDAMQSAVDRLKLDALGLFATAVSVSLRHGSNLDEALSRIAASIRDQQALEDKLSALTASGRASLAVLALFPFGFAAFFYRLDPSGYDKALSTTLGQFAAGGAVLLTFLGIWWGRAILSGVGK